MSSAISENANFIRYLFYSKAYFYSFIVLKDNNKDGLKFFPVTYYLLGRSLELSLKSCLLYSGVKIVDLKNNYRHNLELLTSAVIKTHKIKLSKKEIIVINMLNRYYESKEFEYAISSYKELPALQDVEKIAKKLILYVDGNWEGIFSRNKNKNTKQSKPIRTEITERTIGTRVRTGGAVLAAEENKHT